MALGTTNITTALVRNTLGEDSNAVFHLCSSPNINKWSKCKPVRGTWQAGEGGTYGLNIPTNWNYIQIVENGRLGDFRGYEHSKVNAFPTIQCRDTDQSFNATLYPTGTPSQFLQRWYCRAYRSASNVLILPSDLGLDNYYVGLKLAFGGATWYKTMAQVHDLSSTGTPISVSAELVTWGANPAFSNLPYGYGQCDWQLILSSGSMPAWVNGVGGNTIIYFPVDSDGTNNFIYSGSFNVGDWVVVASAGVKVESLYWEDDVLNYQGGTVYATDQTAPEFHIDSVPAWITAQIYSGGVLIANPALFESGMELRLTPSQNFGQARDGYVVLHSKNNAPFSIYVVQQEAPGSDPIQPVVVVEPLAGEEFTISEYTGSIAIGSNQLTYTFVPAGGYMPGGTSCNVSIINDTTHVEVATDTITARDGYTSPLVVGDRTITISENALGGSRYVVRISIA